MANGNGINPPNTQHPAYQLGRDFLQLLTLAFTFYAAQLGARNNDKLEVVEKKQEVAAVRAEAVKTKIDDKEEETIKNTGVQLYSTWKYLEDVATTSGLTRDKVKAIEARKLYDAHIAKYDGKAVP